MRCPGQTFSGIGFLAESLLFKCLLVLLLLLLGTEVSAQSGYRRIGENQVVVDQASHWRSWDFAAGTIEIGDDGISPARLQRRTNAVLDIVDFLRLRPPESTRDKEPSEIELLDGIEAGSNRAGVVNALDGDMTTSWEPDPPAGDDLDFASQWWFTVDLGQLVIIDRLVVRFAAEGEGDPFLLFDVLVANGQKPSSASQGDVFEYVPVLQTLEPNKTQRVFEVDLSASNPGQLEPLGRFVQVVVRDSDLDRGHLIGEGDEGEAAQAALAVADRGLVEYTKKQPDGREVAVSQDVWEKLEAARQGPIRYYRRERPRLAELEVWGTGDEILHATAERGGHVVTRQEFSADILFDGDIRTGVPLPLNEKVAIEDELFFDLGSWYWINGYRSVSNFRLFGGQGSEYHNYRLDFSDGARQADGSLEWTSTAAFTSAEFSNRGGVTTLSERGIPPSGMILRRHDFDDIKARFFRFVWEVKNILGNDNRHPLADMQLFGSGYQPEVVLVSSPIELPGSRNLTEIEWEVETPPGTQVVLQTKTGNMLIPDTLYYRDDGFLFGRGQEGADTFYSRGQRNFTKNEDKRVIFEEGPEWSTWSPRYEVPEGSAITSPSPRKILKVQASLISDTPDTSATLQSIRLHFAEPVARRLLGEVVPTRVEVLGVERQFTLHVGVDTLEIGFDELVIRPPTGMVLGEDETARDRVRLYAGSTAQFEAGAEDGEQALDEQALGDLLVAEATVARFGDSLLVQFPLIDSGVDVVRLDFPGTLYSSGGLLAASLRSSEEEFWQRVDVGDATKLVESNSLLVVAQLGKDKHLLQEVISPSVITPNGDGINDEAVFAFSVVLMGAGSTAQVEIYDLSGRRLRRIEERREVSAGRYEIPWDGLDDSADLVPPGLYAVRLGLDAVTEGTGVKNTHATTTIAVAY